MAKAVSLPKGLKKNRQPQPEENQEEIPLALCVLVFWTPNIGFGKRCLLILGKGKNPCCDHLGAGEGGEKPWEDRVLLKNW